MSGIEIVIISMRTVLFDIFRHLSTRAKKSKSVKNIFQHFRQFSCGTNFPTPFGGLWVFQVLDFFSDCVLALMLKRRRNRAEQLPKTGGGQKLPRRIYNGLRDVVLWFGAVGMKILDFLRCLPFWGVVGDDVKWFLLCCHAPLNISKCCQIGMRMWFGTPSRTTVGALAEILRGHPSLTFSQITLS